MLAVLLPITRQRRQFCLFICRDPPTCYGVGALSLSIPHGIHLVVPTHPCFFWVVCHPSRTFPPKEPKQECQNRFSHFPTTKPCPLLPLTHDPPLPILARYRLEVFGPCTCSTSLLAAHASAVVWRLCLHILPCTFDFLWRESFSDLPSPVACFL